MKAKAQPKEGRFAYEGLDRVIHERARLSVLTSLIANPKGLIFNDLKQLCSLTDGNLSRHLRVLDQVGFLVRLHDGLLELDFRQARGVNRIVQERQIERAIDW